MEDFKVAEKKTQVAKEPATDSKYVSRVRTKYFEEVVPALIKKFNYKNVNQVPRLVKITINGGLGDVKDNAKSVQQVQQELTQIAGQKPVLTTAKKSVANFKVRQGMNVGIKVTLRGERMYEFFDKLVSIALPRVRDFKGVPTKSFDGRGNYAMGVKEQLIFPEIQYDQVEKVRGFDLCFVTTANTDEEARELLRELGMPFKAE
jgi:large subunit ribosomal protein L5